MPDTSASYSEIRSALHNAILPHVPFEGWSDASFQTACRDAGIEPAMARLACPRGATDLAVEFHKHADREMRNRLAEADLSAMRYSERVTEAVWMRIEAIGDKERARRATALFSLPHLAPEGAQLIWGTADAIWSALGDTSRDINWYSKRAILSGVYGSTVLFWLGDTSDGFSRTREFLSRRISDVMRFEKLKADARNSKSLGPVAEWFARAVSPIKAPPKDYQDHLPGNIGDRS